MLLTSMNSHFFPAIRALSKEAHNLIAKFRIEKDPRRSWCNQYSKTASMFEFSHLFLRCWPAWASPTPGEQNRWRLFSIWTTIDCQYRRCTSKTHLFNRCSQRKPLKAARMSFEPAKVIYVCDSNHYFIYFTQSIHAETPFVRAVNARRFNSGYTCSYLLVTLSAEPLIGLIDIGIARSHSRFTIDHGSRIFKSLPTKNQSATC